jgi:single-stranded-DNA-specific exonuclease
MIEPRFRWIFPETAGLSPELAEAAATHGISPRLAGLMVHRGVRSAADLGAWFGEPAAGLHDPRLLPDAERARTRLELARDRGETVQVFGDFDADGLTGLAILTTALRRFGVAVVPYVPSRLEEGHGLSVGAIHAAVAAGIRLIVTVDCGTSSAREVGLAIERGVEVIVTDHHRVPPELPAAVAVVNPHRADSTYPDRRLAGSGVAFKVAQLLLGDTTAFELADLATIGSVADVAPIVDENRAIARIGLERIRANPRPGIAALLERARIAPASVDLETVAFALAPRLNAAGRMGEALEAAQLLLADDPAEAARHADALEAANLARRDVTKTVLGEARARLEPAAAAASIAHGPWPVGIVGLVASRLVEELGQPAVVGADLDDVIRASCRSGGSLDLGAALEDCRDLFLRYGGHAGAAGFEIERERWPAFVERFGALAEAAAPPDPRLTVAIDLAVPALDVDYRLFRELAGLAPYGPGNPDPLVAILGLTVTRVRAATGGHSQLTLKRQLDVLDGIAFGRSDIAEVVHEGDRLDVVARLTSRTFGGFESLQLDIRDVALHGYHAALAPSPDLRQAGALLAASPG